MKKENVCMREMSTGKTIEIATTISFGEAFGLVMKMRSKRDGNWYWIGDKDNHENL